MGQVLSNFIRSVFGKAEEEERPSEQQNLLISPAISDSCIDPYIESSTHGVVTDIDSSIQVVEDNRQVIGSVEPVSIEYYATVSRESNILFFGRKNPTYPTREEEQAKEDDNEEEKRRNEVERWTQHCSTSHIIQVLKDNWQVSQPFPYLYAREPIREEDQAKEGKKETAAPGTRLPPIQGLSPTYPTREEEKAKEDDNEEEKRRNEVERWTQHCSTSHIIQVLEDNWQVSQPFPYLNAREPIREEDQAKEGKKKWRHRARGSRQYRVWEGQDICNLTPVSTEDVSATQTHDHQVAWEPYHFAKVHPKGNEEEKLNINKVFVTKKKSKRKEVVVKERWIEYYSSSHKILLVGDGDFSFSASLAVAFGSATNMVATSLDSTDVVIRKYKEAKSNLENLEKLGACLLHGVDATKMKLHTDLQMRKFDRIIFNFPHAGFHGKEDDVRIIEIHKNLVHGFFENARGMLSANGEVHVNHKTTAPFCRWNLEDLASQNSLALIECVDFEIENYPGYNNKRGAGSRRDEPFPLGECSTFKFRFSPTAREMFRAKKYRLSLTRRSQQPLGKFCSRSTEGWV